MRILAALLCVGLAGCMSLAQRTQAVALHIRIDSASCSATIIGPHAILSAQHCFEWPYTVHVYGQPVKVERVLLDGNDHIILILDRRFPTWALLGAEPDPGDRVVIVGNPGGFTDMFRSGYVSGQAKVGPGMARLYQLPIFKGDSGAGIFNRHGSLIGVVSFMYHWQDNGFGIQFAGSWPLAFTAEQWRKARTY